MRSSIRVCGMPEMETSGAVVDAPPAGALVALRLLLRDRFALVAAIFLVLLVAGAVLGPWLLEELATRPQLRMRNAPPFTLENGWGYVLGADPLGRSIFARLLVAARTTLTIAAAAVAFALVVGAALGLLAGFTRSWIGDLVMRLTDIVMSFPSTLLAVVILYTFIPGIGTLVAVLAITRLPVYIRTTRAEVLEVRERMFVSASRVMGASSLRIALRHVLPMVLPTLLTIATVEFAVVMLAESGLSFLGIDIQPPEVTWGLMVAQGRGYLGSAWWLAFFPGVAIMLTTLALNLLSGWIRIATDPMQRWRLEVEGGRT
jgi:peptide/nickel transport system permease protein